MATPMFKIRYKKKARVVALPFEVYEGHKATVFHVYYAIQCLRAVQRTDIPLTVDIELERLQKLLIETYYTIQKNKEIYRA